MKETNSHVSAIEQLLFTNEHEPSPSFFCLDTKKRSKKSQDWQGSATFTCPFLNRMKLPSVKQHSVFNGIAGVKLAAEQC